MIRFLAAATAMLVLVGTLIGLSGNIAWAGTDPLVRIVLPEESVTPSTESFDIQIQAENIETIGAFQFRLEFDAEILEYVTVAKGDFLSSTDREVICNEPTVEAAAIRYECISLGETPPGPSGEGTLATVTFRPVEAGTSQLTLADVQLLRPDGNPFPADVVDADIEVESDSSRAALFIIIGIAGAIALAAIIVLGVVTLIRRRRSAAD